MPSNGTCLFLSKLQKVDRITVSTLDNYECENCDQDLLDFHQHLQKMHKMPLIFYCKNCNDYKIVQNFVEIDSFFEHECNSSTFLNVTCKDLWAYMDTSKFISGGDGKCIQLGKDL